MFTPDLTNVGRDTGLLSSGRTWSRVGRKAVDVRRRRKEWKGRGWRAVEGKRLRFPAKWITDVVNRRASPVERREESRKDGQERRRERERGEDGEQGQKGGLKGGLRGKIGRVYIHRLIKAGTTSASMRCRYNNERATAVVVTGSKSKEQGVRSKSKSKSKSGNITAMLLLCGILPSRLP